MSLFLAMAIVWVLGINSVIAAAGLLFTKWRRERRARALSPCEVAVRDLRERTESFSPPVAVNEFERGCWDPQSTGVTQADEFWLAGHR